MAGHDHAHLTHIPTQLLLLLSGAELCLCLCLSGARFMVGHVQKRDQRIHASTFTGG